MRILFHSRIVPSPLTIFLSSRCALVPQTNDGRHDEGHRALHRLAQGEPQGPCGGLQPLLLLRHHEERRAHTRMRAPSFADRPQLLPPSTRTVYIRDQRYFMRSCSKARQTSAAVWLSTLRTRAGGGTALVRARDQVGPCVPHGARRPRRRPGPRRPRTALGSRASRLVSRASRLVSPRRPGMLPGYAPRVRARHVVLDGTRFDWLSPHACTQVKNDRFQSMLLELQRERRKAQQQAGEIPETPR